MQPSLNQRASWVDDLSDEDLAFVKRFILASGSLKALAQDYGISYPTVRLRLDRLIQKIQILEDHTIRSDFERTVRAMYAEGRIDMEAVKQLIGAHQQELASRNGHR
jgi:hypothetical protein